MHRVRTHISSSILRTGLLRTGLVTGLMTGAAWLALLSGPIGSARAQWPSIPSIPSPPPLPRALPKLPAGGDSSSPSAGARTDSQAAAPAAAPAPRAAGLPPFCGRTYGAWSLSDLQRNFEDPKEHDLALLLAAHRSLCDPDAKPEVRQAAENIRVALIKEFGLSAADLKEMPQILSRRREDGIIGLDTGLVSYSGGPLGDRGEALAAPPLAQGAMLVHAFEYHPQKGFWVADSLGDRLSATAQAFMVYRCLKSFTRSRPNDLMLAACLEDLRSLDRARVFKEADAAQIRPDERLGLKVFVSELIAQGAEVEKKLAERAKQDPAYKTVFFEVPAQVKKEWAALAKDHAELFTLTRELEFGGLSGSRRATEGCEAKVWPHLQKHIKAVELPKDVRELPDVAETPLGFVTVSAAYACARTSEEGWNGMASSLGASLTKGQWLRGPRLATIETLLQRGGTLKFDDRSKDLSKDLLRDGYRAFGAFDISGDSTGESAVVEKVEARGGQVSISFRAQEIEEFECLNRVKTDRWRFDTSTKEWGPVMACTKYRPLKVKLTPAAAVVIPSSLAAGIAAGRFISFRRGTKSASPVYVWESAKRNKLIAMYGVSL